MVEIVGHDGFQSCLESHIHTLRPPSTYVHPQLNSYYSSVRLSPKSLELCTEKLGSETGSDERMDNETTEFLYYSSRTMEQRKSSHVLRAVTKNFPPPLTTIRGGSEALKMRPHREEGRLVIEVTKVPSNNASCFQAERSHGRLRLSFFRNMTEQDVDVNDEEAEQQAEMNGVVGQIVEEEEEEEDEDEIRDTCGIRIIQNYERGRSRWEGFHALKIFQHLEILFIKL
ncbi:hypothetical protein Lal_00007265 [Lupinus albus]|uniref:Putative The fantastic four family protein n=1 Tax=Lupinus albus TaxID=3870 RepID=A0A6A4PBH5_LUPAL|nr:putative The fantastic four family protein [Lupinus albus]KAF1874651.1 hypothetical protein Lal_00007265 [Lupinus albus]